MTKQELERMADLNEIIGQLKKKKEQLFESRTSLAIHYSDMPKAQNYEDPMAEYVARLEEYELQLAEVIDEHAALYIRYARAVADLRYRERQVLRLRYERRIGWKKIAKIIGYAESRVYEIHRDALEKIRKF